MPDPSKLKPGDRIRLLAVPESDLLQREREIREGLDGWQLGWAGWTADTLERILAQDPVVVISQIDEYGEPWFEYVLNDDYGENEEHSIAIMDEASWEHC